MKFILGLVLFVLALLPVSAYTQPTTINGKVVHEIEISPVGKKSVKIVNDAKRLFRLQKLSLVDHNGNYCNASIVPQVLKPEQTLILSISPCSYQNNKEILFVTPAVLIKKVW